MTKAAAVHSFFASFGLNAYEESSVPPSAEMPYITYELATGSCGCECAVNADLWYADTSWVGINTKTEEISSALGIGGVMIGCSGGRIRIRRGEPFAISVKEEPRPDVRHKSLNIFVMYLTND